MAALLLDRDEMRRDVERRGNAVPCVIDVVPGAGVSRFRTKGKLVIHASNNERLLIDHADTTSSCQDWKRNLARRFNAWGNGLAAACENVIRSAFRWPVLN